MENPSIKLTSHFILTACLSGGITIILSLIYILLSIASIIFRYNCTDGLVVSASGAEYFWKTIFSAYILSSECEASHIATESVRNAITGEYTVFILTTITLSMSVMCLVTAIILVTVAQDDGAVCYINLVVSAYIGSCIASLVVDLTTASHFGIDFSNLTSVLNNLTAGAGSNYKTDVLRQGAFLLMTIALKGYVAPAINLILLILLIVYAAEHRRLVRSNEHSIHKLGALTAYDNQLRKVEENWPTQPASKSNSPATVSQFARGAQLNNGYTHDDVSPSLPRTPGREPTRNDYNNYNNSNRSYDRSDPWHHTQMTPDHSSRPFTYLEDVKRPVPTRPPPSPAVDAPWRREPWPPAPPVPAPDYSPQPARRLKSALKPAYM